MTHNRIEAELAARSRPFATSDPTVGPDGCNSWSAASLRFTWISLITWDMSDLLERYFNYSLPLSQSIEPVFHDVLITWTEPLS